MTPLAELLAAEIQSAGSISFLHFMETALYHRRHGYYRRDRDPFGKGGDFFTAEQIQPVFGILMASTVRRCWEQMGKPGDFTVVELGAGRREMREAFSEWKYIPVDLDGEKMPGQFTGVVFANEFFDALPVYSAVCRGGAFVERRVTFADGRFQWVEGGALPGRAEQFLRDYFPAPEEGRCYEANPAALDWIGNVASALVEGFVVSIDYGYTRAESSRFPEGTLMSYRAHVALEEVLEEPGERDLTAHVNFTALREYGETRGLASQSFQTLAKTLLAAGEADQFASAIETGDERENLRRRMQLKTLLFGMGETFRTLTQRKP